MRLSVVDVCLVVVGRVDGNCRYAVSAGAESAESVTVRILTVEVAIDQLDSLASADAIVFGLPTYMGSVSGPMMQFMDVTSKV